MSGPYSVYLHIPFCIHRCSYCDFNTYAGMDGWMDGYVAALAVEIRQVCAAARERLTAHTIFFGGGTPSLLSPGQMIILLDALREGFDFTDPIEITLEANPGTVSAGQLSAFREMGINRLSFGMQSANPEELRLLERQHDPLDVIQAVKWAREAGFGNINLDLIFGLPGQDLARWSSSLDFALRLGVEHLSLYALTLEKGTPFYQAMRRGLLPLIDDDLAADMYELAQARLGEHDYRQYEISNWGKQTENGLLACSHNLQYWRNGSWFGFGAGAHGYVSGIRTANVAGIPVYLQRMARDKAVEYPLSHATVRHTRIGWVDEVKETLMMGLRLVEEGVSNREFTRRFGASLQEVFPEEIKACMEFGLTEWAGTEQDRLRLSPRGILLGNQVFARFVNAEIIEPAVKKL